MRIWILLALAAILVGAIGCTSSVHPAIRDDATNNIPTADSGPLATSTTGGDGAGSLNLDANHQGEETASSRPSRRRGRRGGDGG